MSAVLLDKVVAYVRSRFTSQELASVQPYAGEFGMADVRKVSFSCPAVFVTVLGWEPLPSGHRLGGKFARAAKLAAFVVTKSPQRDKRMREAMLLAEKLSLVLSCWMPQLAASGVPLVQVGPLEGEPSAENLYGQAAEEAGLAIWMLDWKQAVKPVLTTAEGNDPGVAGTPALLDWLAVEITDNARTNTPDAAAATSAPLVVTEGINFVST